MPQSFVNNFLRILSALEGVEQAVLTAKVPVVSMGTGGAIIGIALLAEEEIGVFLQAFQSAKEAPATTQPPPNPVGA